MTEGTRSYLIGCHQFLFHPLWVLMAWRLEYRSWPKWWEIICIFLHDVGICGRQYLSDDKAKIGHWWEGAWLAYRVILRLTHDSHFSIQVFGMCAGHCSEESGAPESKLSRADKRSWLVAPMWWLWWNYWIEWHGKGFGVTLHDATIRWKKAVAENLKSAEPIGSHELYLKNQK